MRLIQLPDVQAFAHIPAPVTSWATSKPLTYLLTYLLHGAGYSLKS